MAHFRELPEDEGGITCMNYYSMSTENFIINIIQKVIFFN